MDPLDDPLDPPEGWARDHVRTYVATTGEDATMGGHDWLRGSSVLLLTTLGRRTGRGRRTPLIYGRDGERLLIVASKGGSDDPPLWYGNLAANPRVRVQVKGDVFDAHARTASPEERSRYWPIMTAIWPDYDDYQKKTDREIPIVVLEPTNREQG
jgi:deazaflavin-dependent oxidoreductase (nitroreductase family)